MPLIHYSTDNSDQKWKAGDDRVITGL